MSSMNKKELSEREIRDLLTPRERPVPPADLAERIKQEIPDNISVAPGPAGDPTTTSMPRSRVWLVAASVMIAVGAGLFAVRLMEQMDPPGVASSQADAETPPERHPTEPRSAEAAGAEAGGLDRSVPAPSMEGTIGSAGTAGEFSAETLPEPAPDPAPNALIVPVPAEGSVRRLDERASEADRDDALARRAPLGDGSPADENRTRLREAVTPPPERKQKVEVGAPPPPPAARPAAPPPQPRIVDTLPDIDAYRAVPPPAQPPAARPEAVAEAEPEITVTSEAPRLDAREKKLEAPREGRTYAGSTGNAQIEYRNQKIDAMREEARQLEAELQALESSRVARPPKAPPSTGGTAEPNDAPYGDVFFDSAGTNPFIDTEDDALSTFGLDVDTGSYTVARRYLRDGHLPPPEAVRVEEFVNYFDYGDASPEEAEFAIHAEGAPSIYGESESYHLLRFNLSGREIRERDRRPALLTFVVDVSGSMARENRLALVQQALLLLIDQLRSDDRLALVIYGSRGQVVLEPTGDHGAIRRAILRLTTGGSTNAEEGLALAYELAARHRRRGGINRVILCSDGVANVGNTSAGSILERIRREANQGIELTTVGFGMGNYNDTLMERLADTGNGRYAYVDTLDEARRIFVENLTGTLQTLAAEARVQVEFDPRTVSRYRLLGYENRDIADHRFRDPTVDAGEIGVGHKVTALYEIKLEGKPRAGDRIATLRLRYGSIERGEVVELERAVTVADFARRWRDASPALRLTTLVAEYAEILKRSYWAREGDLEDVFRRAQRLSAEFEGDREVADFVSLVGRAAEYKAREKR